MNALQRPLHYAAAKGRLLLIIGLLLGICVPPLADFLRDYLLVMIFTVITFAAMRIGPRQAVGAIRDIPLVLATIAVFMVAAPILIICGFWLAGAGSTTVAVALTLVAAGAPLSGSPSLTVLSGHEPAPALRLVIVGTALLPITVLPVFWVSPNFADASVVFGAAGRLLILISGATALAFVIRHYLLGEMNAEKTKSLDGLAAISMAIVVIGLMAGAGETLITTPAVFFYWLAIACVTNFGLQLVTGLILRPLMPNSWVPHAIVAGNRNIALFLIALPPDLTDALLLFIGCYQIPMYLTPIVMAKVYRNDSP